MQKQEQQEEQPEGQPSPRIIDLDKQELRLLAQLRALRVVFSRNLIIGLSLTKKKVALTGIEVKPYRQDEDEDDNDDEFDLDEILSISSLPPLQQLTGNEKSRIKQKQNYFG